MAALPHWARPASQHRPLPALLSHGVRAVLFAALPCVAGGLLVAAAMVDRPRVAAGFTILACLLLLATIGAAWWLSARLAESEKRGHAIFERAGISLWREDWTAVGKAVIALKQAGIHDMRAHFTAEPDLARALRRQVIIRDVNAFTVQMMGAADKQAFLGTLDRILPDTDHTFIQWIIAFANGEPYYRSEAHITRPDGSVADTLFVAELPGNLDGFRDIIVTAMDITEFKAAQARLVAAETEIARASRVTTIGALAATIAHEVNSPLSAIVTNAEAGLRWLRRPIPNLIEAEAAITGVIADATRARDVVARTRSFLGNSPRRSAAIDLADAARNAILLVERELRTLGASVHFDADEDVPHVLADPIQIQQVLVNLMINGAQAMADLAQPRDLTITIARDRDDVRVDVRDRGVGIEADHLPRIFDLFYTTRPGGLGMGLAICRNCVEAHGGRLWVNTTAGAGAVFHFSLPISPHV
ncbi:histidine kinase/DNA gyrase B/HSP90-like ATPase [Humitalea rosea]|uniref:histidine kinase n=2 Tax=Humitalea rosea TaxID=990373 RepID=A0A2W7I9D8_9PROT|nr:histidine kinase/DNA gyrase B/HSP90-like ATPase [Humitalea rosea]